MSKLLDVLATWHRPSGAAAHRFLAITSILSGLCSALVVLYHHVTIICVQLVEFIELINPTRPLAHIESACGELERMRVRVRTALSRRTGEPRSVLVILAVCLRYGHREESDDHTFLLVRRNQTLLGSCSRS
jgi:hypothetical protein